MLGSVLDRSPGASRSGDCPRCSLPKKPRTRSEPGFWIWVGTSKSGDWDPGSQPDLKPDLKPDLNLILELILELILRLILELILELILTDLRPDLKPDLGPGLGSFGGLVPTTVFAATGSRGAAETEPGSPGQGIASSHGWRAPPMT